ncbi:immune inhibitor A, partial [bacterium]|nr:immune inhibitor A [bacterium]
MTFERRFVSAVLGLCLVLVLLWGVPLHPDTEAQLRQTDQFQAVRAALLDAHTSGVNQPTTRPIDIRQMSNMDRLELRVLTILVDFEDNPANATQYPVEHYEELLYSVDTFPTGSPADYYLENSYDDVHITGEVVGWYRMPESYAYYVDNNYGFGSYPQNSQRLTEDAVAAADPDIDFSQYDNDNDGYVDALFVVHAGPGAEQTGSTANIWSHAWVTHNVP